MMAQTDFRPQIHGFDFNNTWDTTDNYRNFIRQQLHEALPVVAKAIATNPGIGAALTGALGAAYGAGEVLLPGLFDSIVIPVVVNQIVNQIINAVDDKINNGLPDFYGACGGMAFVPLDYYYNQLVIPKGIYRNGNFNVPPVNIPDAKRLRDYIYHRFEDSWEAGGVLYKMLEWYIVLKTIPDALGGGAAEIRNRSQKEWATLCGLLNQGKPQPISLLFDTWNIFENHQLIAYGYEGDPYTGDAHIHIYDSNNPNKELSIKFNFIDPEMNGIIIDVDNNPVNTYTLSLKGFFCTTYIAKTPPFGWGLQEVNVQPDACISAKESYQLSGIAANAFSFFQDPLEDFTTQLTAIQSDALNFTIFPDNYISGYALPVCNAGPLFFNNPVSYNHPGIYLVFTKVWMTARKSDGDILSDRYGQPLASILSLKPLYVQVQSTLQLHVMERLQPVAVNYSGNACFEPFIEGENVTLELKNAPFGNSQVWYQWTVYGASTGNTQQEKLGLFNLPAAGSTVTISVTVTNLKNGCVASGNLHIITYTGEIAAYRSAICKLIHTMETIRIPGLVDPPGPDDPEYTKLVQQHIGLLNKAAAQITKLSDAIMQANQQGIRL